MSLLRNFGTPLRRLPSDVSGQTVVNYAIVACLVAAVLVLATSVWMPDGIFASGTAPGSGR